jgi:hypothetical protein
MDIRRLGKQLGGQISITSSDSMTSPGDNFVDDRLTAMLCI